MTRAELINHLEHLAEYVKYSEDAPALREVIEMLKCSEMPNSSKDFFWKNARKNARKYTETHACDLIKRQDAIDAVNSIDNLDAKARGGICFKLMGLPHAQPDHHIAEVGKKVDSDVISRQAAINIVRNRVKRYTTACVLAVTELQQLPPAQPQSTMGQVNDTVQSTNDCISRQSAIDVAMQYCPDDDGSCSKAGADIREMLDELESLPPVQPEQRWIPCSERMPECEQEVLICTKKKIHISENSGLEWYEEPIITPALHEDGTMLEANSKWRWEDIDYEGWDEEEDCGIIPEGWWENRHFNQDEVYNNIVDKEVIAWMPLPEPYKERREDG